MKVLNTMLALGLLALNVPIKAETLEAGKPVAMVVYRSPSCECCGKWLEHIKKNNFTVKDIVTDDVQTVKDKYGVSAAMASCHTAIVDGYVIEGHVPANDRGDKFRHDHRDRVEIQPPGYIDRNRDHDQNDRNIVHER